MKKYIISCCLFLFPFLLLAQGLRFGVFAEPKSCWLNSDVSGIESDGVKFGFNGGLAMYNFFAENYAIATGLSINNTGGHVLLNEPLTMETKDGDINFSSDSRFTYKLQYLNVPFGLKLKTNPIGYWSFNSELGVLSRVNVQARVDSEDHPDTKVLNEINLFGMGYFFGAGGEYDIGGSSAITISVFYNNGFLDITQREEDVITLSNVSVRLGLMF